METEIIQIIFLFLLTTRRENKVKVFLNSRLIHNMYYILINIIHCYQT
jgi:hypothetical protein